MKPLTLLSFGLFLFAVVLGLVQLWFRAWSNETFFKIALTDTALLSVSIVAGFLIRESKESKKINGGNGLD